MTTRDDGQRKLIDQVVPAPAGDPLIGILATTYELQAEFVETDLLPAIFGLGGWDDRSWTSRIAIERRLAELDSAVLFQAAEQYRGRPRSLRIEVVPIPSNGHRVLHAKVMLLVNQSSIRLMVASSNLTEPGYRKNREVAVVLAAAANKTAQVPLIRGCLQSMPGALESWWTTSAENLAERALEQLDDWLPRDPPDPDEMFVWSGGERPLWSVFVEQWPAGEAVQTISIVSPFWSDSEQPIEQLVQAATARGGLALDAQLRLLAEARSETSRSWLPVLPPAYGTFDARRLGLTARAFPVDPRVSRDEAGIEDDRPRPLHAKMVMLEGSRTSLTYIGSANFSRHGWGVLRNPREANIEAGVILRRSGKARDTLSALLPPTVGAGVALDGGAGNRVATPEPTLDPRPWPTFVRSARLVRAVDAPSRLDLEIELALGAIAGPWRIETDVGGDSDSAYSLLTGPGGASDSAGLSRCHVALPADVLRRLLTTSQVTVHWWGAQEPREFPINVDAAAREEMPVAPGSGLPGENLLLQYYQSRIAFEEMFPPPPGYDPVSNEDVVALGDGNDLGVDTSRIQSYQIREFVEALRGIHDDLHRASAARGAMRQALLGPVSPVALARMVARTVRESKRTPTAGAFQLVEIAACLSQARRFDVRETDRDHWIALVDEAAGDVDEQLALLRTGAPSLASSRAFVRYERAVRTLAHRLDTIR